MLKMASTSMYHGIKAKCVLDDSPILTAVRQRAALCAHKVFKEKCWFGQPEIRPEGIIKPHLDQSHLLLYQNEIWNNDPCENLPKFGMTADEMSHLCSDAQLLSPHMIWMMEQLNRMQRNAICFYLQGSPAASLIPHLQRRGLKLELVKLLVSVVSVDKYPDGTVFFSNESGSHWVLIVVEIDLKRVYYCDSLAWGAPSDLLQILQEYCDYFDFQLKPSCLVLCHQPVLPGHDQQHACSDGCRNYSLQTSRSGVSGVITLINAAVSARDWKMFSHLIGSARNTCYLKHPTEYEVYLRKVLICWFMTGTIDLQNIQVKTRAGQSWSGKTSVRDRQEHLQPGQASAKKPMKRPSSGTPGEESTQPGESNGANSTDSASATARKAQVVLECNICHNALGSRAALFKHKRSKHPEARHSVALEKSLVQCMDCDMRCFYVTKLIEHYQTAHGRQFSVKKKHFASEAEFHSWKKWIEKTTRAMFVQHSGKRKTSTSVVRNLRCHRSGFFRSKGQGKRNLKSQGSAKINGTCPAFIKSTLDRVLLSVDAEFCLDHTHECEVEHLTLSLDSRKEIAEKLARGLSVEAIVDEVRHSSTAVDRDYLVTRRDVMNVKLTLDVEIDATAYYAAIDTAKMEALNTVQEVTSLINDASSVDILTSMQKHLQSAVKTGKGVLSIDEDHNYQ